MKNLVTHFPKKIESLINMEGVIIFIF